MVLVLEGVLIGKRGITHRHDVRRIHDLRLVRGWVLLCWRIVLGVRIGREEKVRRISTVGLLWKPLRC
jgi:hypothetical protein